MKAPTRIIVVAVVLAGVAVSIIITTDPFGRDDSSTDDRTSSFSDAPPDFLLTGEAPAFPSECGDDVANVGSGGPFGINTDIEHHTREAIAVVEGNVRVAGPARFGPVVYTPGMSGSEKIGVASGITTPFTIDVSKTHKGPDQPVWDVSQVGGLVGCASYQLPAETFRVFDGVEGLFFISAVDAERRGNGVSMTVAKDAPDWFIFTEDELMVLLDDAVATVEASR